MPNLSIVTSTKILNEDKEYFDQKINFLKKGKPLNVFFSFTYITPNYDVITSLKELKDFLKDFDFRLYLVLWDMNAIANPYFKKYLSHKIKDTDSFILEKIVELRGILKAVGFKDDDFEIIKSSEMWRKLILYKDENIFQNYYSILARLPVKEYANFHKSSHLFQITLDMFFVSNLSKLYPDTQNVDIDIVFADYYRSKLYQDTRRIMLEEGYMSRKPLFLLMKQVPYIAYEDMTPEWNMDIEEIRYVLMHAQNSLEDYFVLLKYFKPNYIKTKNINKEEVVDILSSEIYSFLNKYKNIYGQCAPSKNVSLLKIETKHQAIALGHILKSKIFLDILMLADGTNTVSQISHKLKKSLATISQYCTELKAQGYVFADDNGNIIRTVKSIKIDFESDFR